jgi:RecA/RadA recombinase
MNQSFFKKFIADIGDPDTALAVDGKSAAEYTGFIDSGSYMLNTALSGSMFGGLPNNKALVLAGDPAVGKSFFALSIVSQFLKENESARVVYFDTESAITNDMLSARGIDLNRIVKSEPDSIERFRTVALKMLDTYAKIPTEDRFPMLMVLDSLSALPSGKEIGDITDGKDTRDMTKSQLIKGAFRVLRLKMAKLQIPMIITSHTYAVIGAYVPTKEMAGGSGAKYAADTIAFLSKSKERDSDKKVIGNIVKVRMVKSRMTKEETVVETRIMFDGGLDRYYGLLDFAQDAGLVKRVGNKYEFPNGAKAFENAVLSNPEKYFTQDILDQLNVFMKERFLYTGEVTTDISELEEVAE